MNSQQFKQDVRKAIAEAIRKAKADGTVAVGLDCLWQLTATHIRSSAGPVGTNAAWVARQVFNEIVNAEFAGFICQ